MISELKIRNFKSLESVDLKLGHFNLLVGANASGKSNFLDALRFLQGVGTSFNIDEVLDGALPSGTSRRSRGIRGGSKFAAFRNREGIQAREIGLIVTFTDEGLRKIDGSRISLPSSDTLRYDLAFNVADGYPSFGKESLSYGNMLVVPEDHKHVLESLMRENSDEIDPDLLRRRSIFVVIPAAARIVPYSTPSWPGLIRWPALFANYASSAMADMQFLDPLPSVLRGYSLSETRLGENGEGFAGLIHEIESNGSKPALLEWLKELRPDEVSDLFALPGAVNDYMPAFQEGNTVYPAPAISEGTLRFTSLVAAFFQPSMSKVLVIEEIEKGLHPSRLRLLLELMRSQSKRAGIQVFATTHSPTLLNWLTQEDRKTTFVCTRDAESGATKMRSLADVPNLEKLIQKNYNLDQLFEEGWLESVLHES